MQIYLNKITPSLWLTVTLSTHTTAVSKSGTHKHTLLTLGPYWSLQLNWRLAAPKWPSCYFIYTSILVTAHCRHEVSVVHCSTLCLCTLLQWLLWSRLRWAADPHVQHMAVLTEGCLCVMHQRPTVNPRTSTVTQRACQPLCLNHETGTQNIAN